MAFGETHDECHCITEQGTTYLMDHDVCVIVAVDGQYEPFRDVADGELKRMDAVKQRENLMNAQLKDEATPLVPHGLASEIQVTPYGAFRP